MEQAVNLQNTSQAGYTAGASKWKKRIGYGVGDRIQCCIQHHGVLSHDILYRCIWNLGSSGRNPDAGHKVYRRAD